MLPFNKFAVLLFFQTKYLPFISEEDNKTPPRHQVEILNWSNLSLVFTNNYKISLEFLALILCCYNLIANFSSGNTFTNIQVYTSLREMRNVSYGIDHFTVVLYHGLINYTDTTAFCAFS
jgi:hypothetical protein